MEWLASLSNPRFRHFRAGKEAYEAYLATYLTARQLSFEDLDEQEFARARKDVSLAGAVANYRAAIDGSRKEDAIGDLATACYQIGMLHHLRGELADAETSMREALSAFGDLIQMTHGKRQSISGCHYHLGILAWRRGATAEAIACLERSLEIDVRIVDLQGQAMTRRAIEIVKG